MKIISRLLVAGLLSTAAIAPAQAEVVKITLLGVGDVYNFAGGKTRGGMARLNAVARSERAANPNFLYLFDGDLLSPSLLSGLDRGMNMIELTNVVPFDLAVPGNHEYDFGVREFRRQDEGVEISLGGDQHHARRRFRRSGAWRGDDEGSCGSEDRADPGGAGHLAASGFHR